MRRKRSVGPEASVMDSTMEMTSQGTVDTRSIRNHDLKYASRMLGRSFIRRPYLFVTAMLNCKMKSMRKRRSSSRLRTIYRFISGLRKPMSNGVKREMNTMHPAMSVSQRCRRSSEGRSTGKSDAPLDSSAWCTSGSPLCSSSSSSSPSSSDSSTLLLRLLDPGAFTAPRRAFFPFTPRFSASPCKVPGCALDSELIFLGLNRPPIEVTSCAVSFPDCWSEKLDLADWELYGLSLGTASFRRGLSIFNSFVSKFTF
mmetsp:Transcript_15275/g.29458  ORF Transcript_15275/g.29458 Transcript_15275/m.29458 type:complete len:256 (-) Transcript_15275:44-811(-)